MVGAGILGEDDRVELVEGEILELPPIGDWHAATVDRLHYVFARRLGDRAIVRDQNPLRLSERSEPEPDLVVVRPRSDFYAGGHPTPEDALLVVEVMDTSASYDRSVKVPLYARAGLREVWLIERDRPFVEVYDEPAGDVYRSVHLYMRGERVAPAAFGELDFSVDEILG
jgi:Uma2 family endonuclease